MGYMDGRIDPPWVDDHEWEQEEYLDCENDVDSHPEGVECNDSCAPEDGNHMCGFSGDVLMSCVGQRTFSAHYICPWCGDENYLEKEGGDDY